MSTAVAIRRELIRRELARRHYADYLSLVYGKAWIPTRFSTFLSQNVENFLASPSDNAYDMLILETPPQHGKSMTVTEALPSWWLITHPDQRIIIASYNEDSAARFSRRNREKLRDWGPILSGISLGDMKRATEFELADHPGRCISRGIMSGITGNPANLLIIDDPIKNREEADSPAYREKLWDEWLNSLKSRLAAKAKIILIMTPWHEDDLAARILKTEEHVQLIRLPVEAERNPAVPDPLGRTPGEPLCPEIGKDAHWLAQFKKAYLNDPSGGARAWAALYMCSPRIEGGNLVRRDWWQFYDTPPQCPFQIISVDAAFKATENNDFVAITVWGKAGENYYLLDCRNEHLTFTQTVHAIRDVRKQYPAARAVLIEDKANGAAVMDVLRHEAFCIPVTPGDSKTSRVQGVAPAIEAGHVYLPRRAPWLEAYLDQWTAFPAAPHDDMVDSSSQALSYLFGKISPAPVPAETALRIQQRQEALEDMFGENSFDVYEFSNEI